MKILCVNQDRGITPTRKKGAAVHLRAIREAFVQLGHEVVAIDEPNDVQLSERLDQLATDFAFDLIYERYALGKTFSSCYAKRHLVPHVLEVNAPLAEEAQRWRYSQQPTDFLIQETEMFSRAARIVAVSPDTRRYSLERGAQAENIRVLANGYDPRVFYPRDKAHCKSRLNIPSDTLVIGFHGRLRPWHRFDTLVRSVAQLQQKGLRVHLLTVGEGDYRKVSDPILSKADHTHRSWVELEQLGDLVGAYDVLPLMYDTHEPCYFSPLKLYEAMACGALALVPDAGPLPDLVTHQKTGIVYRQGQLTQNLQELYQDRSRLEQLSQAGSSAAKTHTWTAVAKLTLADLP